MKILKSVSLVLRRRLEQISLLVQGELKTHDKLSALSKSLFSTWISHIYKKSFNYDDHKPLDISLCLIIPYRTVLIFCLVTRTMVSFLNSCKRCVSITINHGNTKTLYIGNLITVKVWLRFIFIFFILIEIAIAKYEILFTGKWSLIVFL